MDEEKYNKLSPRMQKRYMKCTYYNEKGEEKVCYTKVPPSADKLWDMWDKLYPSDMDKE